MRKQFRFNDGQFIDKVQTTPRIVGYSLRYAVTANGTPTRYFKILLMLEKNGPMSKRELLGAILTESQLNNISVGGYYASTFSKFAHNGVLRYNPADRKWYPGDHFKTFMELSKRRLVHRVTY